MTELLGEHLARAILARLKEEKIPDHYLAIVVVAPDPTTESFIRQKKKVAEELGVDFRLYKFPEESTQDELRKEVGKIAAHKNCGGVIIQLPLPPHINRHYVLNVIPREKDVDVLGERALGAFYANRNPILPPALGTVIALTETVRVKFEEIKMAVIGSGLLIGRPIALWASSHVKEMAVFGKSTTDLNQKLKHYDLIVSGAGSPRLFSAKDCSSGAMVIDFGYGKKGEELEGDFDSRGHEVIPGVYTPTPGGTGPILVAKLFENFYRLSSPR
ncbi:MAG: bifunctional 5,10-methylenetetrahydrofolate dehydrogenase/5,10-methenyltetrahydrofolate cyclohydrolase [Anaplasmataceae bacterium]|nr:bifunctional 5,10-methylenetetrahydrofolate dehydrogenase/5,10-methenyltetrahydrofolate cyclohydrolase [Anaplasmataceae bacterium]